MTLPQPAKWHVLVSQNSTSRIPAEWHSVTSVPIEHCDTIVVLGGDGFMLRCMAKLWKYGKPFYGLNFGSSGALMNPAVSPQDLHNSITQAYPIQCPALSIKLWDNDNQLLEHFYAFNDVVLFRKAYRAIHFNISVNRKVLVPFCFGDGVLSCTPLGSGGYNASAGGPLLSFQQPLMALRPLNLYSPKEWTGNILGPSDTLKIGLLSCPQQRPAYIGWDAFEQDLSPTFQSLEVQLDLQLKITILRNSDLHFYDPGALTLEKKGLLF